MKFIDVFIDITGNSDIVDITGGKVDVVEHLPVNNNLSVINDSSTPPEIGSQEETNQELSCSLVFDVESKVTKDCNFSITNTNTLIPLTTSTNTCVDISTETRLTVSTIVNDMISLICRTEGFYLHLFLLSVFMKIYLC